MGRKAEADATAYLLNSHEVFGKMGGGGLEARENIYHGAASIVQSA